MSGMLPVVLAAGVLLALLVLLYAIALQRSLVRLDELCSNALAQIGVQMNARWDGLAALAEMMGAYAKGERDVLRRSVEQRSPFGGHVAREEVERQEGLFEEAMEHLRAFVESHPGLQADLMFRSAMEGVAGAEEKVRMSRMVYNDTVTKLNRAVRVFLASLLSGLMGFWPQEYLKNPEGRRGTGIRA